MMKLYKLHMTGIIEATSTNPRQTEWDYSCLKRKQGATAHQSEQNLLVGAHLVRRLVSKVITFLQAKSIQHS